jgi:hypothetical protein
MKQIFEVGEHPHLQWRNRSLRTRILASLTRPTDSCSCGGMCRNCAGVRRLFANPSERAGSRITGQLCVGIKRVGVLESNMDAAAQ